MMRNSCNLQLSLFFLILGVSDVFSGTEYVETGRSYSFRPYIKIRVEAILWKFNNEKVVEYDDGLLKWFQFEDRGVLATETGVLTLKGLKKSDSGQYEVEILGGGILQTSKYDLRVIDAVSQPKVACIKDNTGEVTSLECSVDFNIPSVYQWTGPGDMKHTGRTLNITNSTDLTAVYSCTAENPVSKNSTEFLLKECQTGDVFNGTDCVETGKSYSFRPNITTRIESILWKFNNEKVVEYEDGVLKWFQFEDRGVLATETGVLTLKGLKKSDSGLYEVEILGGGILQTSKYDLRVIDAVHSQWSVSKTTMAK
ncbi:T-lymphocyte surface antigen Ly-9 isoform X1 [Astyanax mexicanus]|uniref:T-lymphocyte surface antigen Ly-9 isoform X1 n=1 Tax=Astyanax mexicanus TaxID=7994 RepID=UPI0020CB3B55|nr:T-lymphocyte surface antigen Ly-9 isoform X1 [Astyanax mexicanus]